MQHQVNHKLSKKLQNSKQDFRANGSILPLALRPGLVILFILLSISGTFVINSFDRSNSVSATSITLSIPNSLSLDINSSSPNGTFSKSSPVTISTKTDSTTGYTLSIKSKDSVDSNCLKNGDNKINSISFNMTEDQFKNSAPANTWGYQPDKFDSVANSNFLPGPNNTESIIDKTTSANPVLGNNYNIVLAAKVNTKLPAGTYKNTYILSATSNALNYSVTYNLNSGTWSGKSPQIGQASGTEFKLDSNIPTKDGFEFVGWCTKETSDTTCSGGVYQAGATYDINCDNNDINMYAMWEKAEPSMQNFSCSSLSLNQTITMLDKRDGNTYTIAKLKDNNCWMTDNLRIANKTLTSADSDVESSFPLPSSSTNGFSDYDKTYVYIDNTYGGYYSWYAATAGEGTENKTNGDTTHSICPKGWRLPTKVEYDNLISAYSASKNGKVLQNVPANFKKGGYYSGTFNNGSPATLEYFDEEGRYWSSTTNDTYHAWSLTFYDSSAETTTYNDMDDNNSSGFSVRCISRQ